MATTNSPCKPTSQRSKAARRIVRLSTTAPPGLSTQIANTSFARSIPMVVRCSMTSPLVSGLNVARRQSWHWMPATSTSPRDGEVPSIPSRNSLLYQINISKTSVRHQHKRGTSASYQLSIRRTSEEHQNIREISEKHQRNISQSGCVQVDIRYASVNHQLRSQRQTINCA